jgi:hypothetical protein
MQGTRPSDQEADGSGAGRSSDVYVDICVDMTASAAGWENLTY